MDVIKELREMKETIAHEIAEANDKIRQAGGDMNTADVDIIDKLTHSMKSLATTCAMLEAEESDGYSGRYYDGPGRGWREGYREMRNGYGGNYGSYAREGSRYSRDNRNGYSRGMDWNDSLRQMMDEAPDEATRMDIKKLMDRMAN